MSDKLPELPPADFAAWAEGDNGIPKITTGYSSEATLAYGQQCYQQALEDAAKVCDERGNRFHPALAFSAELHNCAAAIRALKDKP